MKTFTHDEEDKCKTFKLDKNSIDEFANYGARIRSDRITATEVILNARQVGRTDRMRRRWIDEEL